MKASSFYFPALYFLVTFVLLTLPGDELPKAGIFDFPHFDKLVHTGMFFLLTALFCRPFRKSVYSVKTRRLWFLKIALYAFAYGILIEFIQKYFVPFRSFELADIGVDGLGALCGYLVSKRLFARTKLL